MAIGLLGKKIGMTQIFRADGELVPVTVIEAGPCLILQVKDTESYGYSAVQLGFENKKISRVNKPDLGHFKKAGVEPKKFIKEIRIESTDNLRIGEEIGVGIFELGDFVDITGVSIGKGFQGGMKRWHWKGGKKSHGSMQHRAPGSIGASSDPSRVFKGHHLPGRMGGERRTVQNLEVIRVDKKKNLLLVKGSVPGHRNSYLVIRRAKKKPSNQQKVESRE